MISLYLGLDLVFGFIDMFGVGLDFGFRALSLGFGYGDGRFGNLDCIGLNLDLGFFGI